MKISHLVVGALCLLFGAVGAFFFAVNGIHQPFTANDSPVTVRGGSVVVRTGDWNPIPKTSTTVFQTSTNTTSVAFDGVVANGSKAPKEYTQPNLANNWQLTLNFRLPNTQKDTGDKNLTKLFLCSKLNNAQTACDPTGTLTSGNLYLVIESDAGGKFNDELPNLENFIRKRYDLKICGSNTDSTVRDSACNHIYDIEVDGIPAWAGLSPFQCLAGDCDIGIGPPLTMITPL